jgi:hypothetical protein
MGQQTSTQDAFLLGLIQGKMKLGTELFAGLRAELAPSPLHTSLSTFGGRIAARVMTSLIRNKSMVNYQRYRTRTFAAAIARAIPPDQHKLTLVDAPSGFSPLGVMLAEQYPQADVLDMDLREIIHDKRRRLERGHQVVIPPNIHFIEADFRKTALEQVLNEHGHPRIDVISFLSSSFAFDELNRLARYLRGLLTDNGAVVCFSPWKPIMQAEHDASSLLRRQVQVGWSGIFQSKEQAVEIFQQAGYRDVKVYLPTELCKDFPVTGDIIDAEVFVVARR